MNFPGSGDAGPGGAGIPGLPVAGARAAGAAAGFDPNDPNVKWVCRTSLYWGLCHMLG